MKTKIYNLIIYLVILFFGIWAYEISDEPYKFLTAFIAGSWSLPFFNNFMGGK